MPQKAISSRKPLAPPRSLRPARPPVVPSLSSKSSLVGQNRPQETFRCVLYCRVSSAKQQTQGDGLAGQELSCRSYAAMKGYQVCHVFSDGVTGAVDDRRGLLQMLAYLESQPPGIIVIIDDLKRFARDVILHYGLKETIAERGGRLESPTFHFDDTPEAHFMETVLAAGGELERHQNQRQVVNRMAARLEQGFWPFREPLGYRFERHPALKKILVPDAKSRLVREALEGFAAGRFTRASQVERHLLAAGFWSASPPGESPGKLFARLKQVGVMLRQPLYAGLVGHEPWGISPRKGQHEALISIETYERIQERLAGRIPTRSEGGPRHFFALRGVVRCADCDRLMTASLSRNKAGRRYGYYHCARAGCPQYGKTIPCHLMEDEFAKLLEPLTLTDAAFEIVVKWAEHHAANAAATAAQVRERLVAEQQDIDERIDKLVEAAALTGSSAVMRSLDEKIEDLARQRERIDARIAEMDSPDFKPVAPDVGTLVMRLRPLLQNPLQAFVSGDAKIRHAVARVVFPQSVVYRRKSCVGTPGYALCYSVLGTVTQQEGNMVDLNADVWNLFGRGLRDMAGILDGLAADGSDG